MASGQLTGLGTLIDSSRPENGAFGILSPAHRQLRSLPLLPPSSTRQDGTEWCPELERPDLVMIDKVNRKAMIVDVTIPTPSRSVSLEGSRWGNVKKYMWLADALEDVGFQIDLLDGFVIGTTGAYMKKNDKLIEVLNVSKSYAKKMKQFMVVDVIRCSADIYEEHIRYKPNENCPAAALQGRNFS